MSIIIMLNYARSGGTLLNKCLCALPDTVVLSELNPLGGGHGEKKKFSPITVKEQALKWYGIMIHNEDFANGVRELYEICKIQGKTLIIRDWSFINFHPCTFNNFKPPYEFLIIKVLKEIADLKILGLIRDAIDIWISRGTPRIPQFANDYSSYLEALFKLNVPIIKYEAFCANPKRVMKNICKLFSIQYDSSFINKFHLIDNVAGDTSFGEKSRGYKTTVIKQPCRKPIRIDKLVLFSFARQIKQINVKYNYSPNYITTMASVKDLILYNLSLLSD